MRCTTVITTVTYVIPRRRFVASRVISWIVAGASLALLVASLITLLT